MKPPLIRTRPEGEHRSGTDKFWLGFTPAWLDWLSRVSVVGFLQFVFTKSNNPLLFLILLVSYTAINGYVLAQFFKVELRLPGIKSERIARAIPFVIQFVLGLLTYLLVAAVIQEIGRSG